MSVDERVKSLDQRLVELLTERIEVLRSLESSAEHSQHRFELADQYCHQIPRELLIDWLGYVASISARQAWPTLSVIYLGPIYSFSYLAAASYFGLGAELIPVASINAAFEEIVRKQAAFAVVPIENNTDGRIVDTLSRFAATPVQICGEILLPVQHCLLGQGDRHQIREVHSKPQAISQCRQWLQEHLPDVALVEVSSTAAAASAAAANPSIAAIASRQAGVHYGCRIIAENIEDNSQNVTRFAVIGNQASEPTGNDKTSLIFEVNHQPGALADAMMVFKSAGVNLTWIESFPLPNRPNEYLFFVELDGHQQTQSVQSAIANLGLITKRLDVLGSYPKASKI